MEVLLSELNEKKRMMIYQLNALVQQQQNLISSVVHYGILGPKDGDHFETEYNICNEHSLQIKCLEYDLKHLEDEINNVTNVNVEQYGVRSEVGRLEIVLMHRPGSELRRLTLENLTTLLFDALPNLNHTYISHNLFADYLRQQSIEVLYVSDILRETLRNSKLAIRELIDGIVKKSLPQVKDHLQLWLEKRDVEQLARDVIEGVQCNYNEIGQTDIGQILLKLCPIGDYLVPPLPNLMFTRDSFSIIEDKVVIHKMAYAARQNEPLIMSIIFKYYPRFVEHLEVIDWQKHVKNSEATIEGGDLAYLGNGTLLIGCSERTNDVAIDALAKTMFDLGILKRVIVVGIPKSRDYMHLDIVMSAVSSCAFTLHGRLATIMEIFEVTPDVINNSCRWTAKGKNVGDVLENLLGKSLTFYDAKTEKVSIKDQTNCRHNVLAIDEYHIATYSGGDDESSITSQMIGHPQFPCTVFSVPTAGLLEGAGGAHCLTNGIRRRSC